MAFKSALAKGAKVAKKFLDTTSRIGKGALIGGMVGGAMKAKAAPMKKYMGTSDGQLLRSPMTGMKSEVTGIARNLTKQNASPSQMKKRKR
jgi:hypothetical protein